jgi:hypothetical protein
MIIDGKRLSDPCYKIICAMHRTGVFSSRAPNKDKPTKLHLEVQEYLDWLFNGAWHVLMAHYIGKYSRTYLDPLIGDWAKIESAVVNSIPTDRPMYNDMATFFWNPNTNTSRFLQLVNIKAYDTPETSIQDIKELKRRELPNDVSRCTEIMCPKADTCMRVKARGEGSRVVVSTFLFDENGCENYIGEQSE